VKLWEIIRFATHAIVGHRLRSALTALGIAIGVAAVVLLTSMGEGLHQYLFTQFTQFGTTLVGINPGKATTFGVSPGVFGSVRPLSIEDAEALRRVPYATASVPMVQGDAAVEGGGRERRTSVYGVGHEFDTAFKFNVAIGKFLPPDDPRAARAFAVLGAKVRDELFGDGNPLGERIRIGGDRYRVVGVMESKGNMLGIDLDDAVYVPAGKGLELFNREGLFEIDLIYEDGAPLEEVVAAIRRMLIARHGGEDFTITTQQQMMDVMGNILNFVTFGVGALGGISLLVGGVGIFTIMTIAVRERTPEIGLLRAIGARRRGILRIFLGESVLLAALGGLLGLALGGGIALLLGWLVPALPVKIAPMYVLIAETVAVLIGLVAGVLPARKAAEMEPLEALRAE
jgi:putative ABC transport system permease protein